MDIFRRKKFDEAMFAKNRTLAIRVGQYQSRDINEASFDYGYIKGDTYKPGGTCAGSAKIVFSSVITSFRKLDKIYPEIGLLVDGTYEWVKMGEYFINDIEIDRNRKTTKLDLMDGMFKLNREHVTDLTYPAEIRHIIKEICLKTGITLANEYMDITSMNYRIESIPKEKKMTFRDVLSLATQMLGMSCFFNREGKLEIKELTDSGIVITADSYFMHGLTKSEVEYQIAGITCKKDKETLTVGMRTGRSLELDNLFMSQAILDNLYHKIKDIRYYPFNLNYQGHLLLNVGEWVTIKTNTGETFKSPVLSQSFTFKGGLRGRISADSKSGNDAQYSYAGTLTKKIVQFDEFEAQIQNQIEEADKGFDQKIAKIKKDFSDQVELAKARAEEVKRELSDTIEQRFSSFNNGPLQEIKRRAEEALRNAGASSLLAQEAKRIGLDSIARLEAFKSQATSAQTALSGDLDALKRTIANDIRPKQEQVTSEIAKQVEALIQTKNELSGIKSAQATYEETTARRLSELTNLANGKASKSELIQTAEELKSRIVSVETGSSRNYFRNSRSRPFTTNEQAVYDYRLFIAPDFWKNKDRLKRDYVRLSFDVTFPVALARDMPAMVHFGASPWYAYRDLVFKGGTTERQHFEFTIDLSGAAETYQTNNVFIRFGTNYGFPAGLQVVIKNAMLSVGNYFPAYQPAYEDQEDRVSVVESNFKQRADSLDAGVSRLTEGLRSKADISSLNVTAENIRQSVKSLETNTQNKLNQMLSMAEFEVRAGSIRQEILNATKDKADKTLVTAEAGKLREELASLSVGGVNLLKRTKAFDRVNGQSQLLSETYNNCAIRYFKNADANSAYQDIVEYSNALYPELGGTYTLSFWAKGAGEMTTFFYGRRGFLPVSSGTTSQGLVSKAGDGNCRFTLSADWQRYYVVYKLADTPAEATSIYKHVLFRHVSRSTTDEIWLAGVKLERGNLATDYSESPEDTEGIITEAKATFERTAQGLRADLSAIQAYVNKDGQRQEALRKYSRDESARQATAVRELVTRDYVGKASHQEDVRAIERRFDAITNPQNGSIATQIAKYKTAVDGRFAEITSMISGKANQADFQRVRETSQLYERILGNTNNSIADNIARMAMTSQLFQIEVSKNENLKTVQSQLAGSWAVQNLTSAGAIISQINATNNQILIEAEKIRLKGKTLLDELTAIQGYFKRLFVGEGAFAKLNAEIIASKTITADKLVMDMAMARMFVSSDIFTDTLAAKEAFINKLRSVVVTATLLEGYKGRIGGFQIGTHEKDSSVYWITGQNQFSVGMSNGSGQWSQTALWVNWGNNWGYPGDYAWYVKHTGQMYCYNRAEFWNTPIIHGDLKVTGHIFYNNENSGKSGYWIHSSKYSNFEPSNDYLYLYYSGSGYDWIPMNKEISDRRYKHNIEASTVSGIDVIENLKTYSYRKEYDGKIEDISCGIMAQDVQKYAPEAFFENPDGAYSYNTFALVPYLIKAIQELNQKIEKLEKTA